MLLFRILQRMLDIAAGGDGVVKSSGNDGKEHPTRKLIIRYFNALAACYGR